MSITALSCEHKLLFSPLIVRAELTPLTHCLSFERWHRAVYDFPNRMAFQRMDDSFTGFGAAINADAKTILLSKDSDKN